MTTQATYTLTADETPKAIYGIFPQDNRIGRRTAAADAARTYKTERGATAWVAKNGGAASWDVIAIPSSMQTTPAWATTKAVVLRTVKQSELFAGNGMSMVEAAYQIGFGSIEMDVMGDNGAYRRWFFVVADGRIGESYQHEMAALGIAESLARVAGYAFPAPVVEAEAVVEAAPVVEADGAMIAAITSAPAGNKSLVDWRPAYALLYMNPALPVGGALDRLPSNGYDRLIKGQMAPPVGGAWEGTCPTGLAGSVGPAIGGGTQVGGERQEGAV